MCGAAFDCTTQGLARVGYLFDAKQPAIAPPAAAPTTAPLGPPTASRGATICHHLPLPGAVHGHEVTGSPNARQVRRSNLAIRSGSASPSRTSAHVADLACEQRAPPS